MIDVFALFPTFYDVSVSSDKKNKICDKAGTDFSNCESTCDLTNVQAKNIWYKIVARRSDTTFYDLLISRNQFSKAEIANFTQREPIGQLSRRNGIKPYIFSLEEFGGYIGVFQSLDSFTTYPSQIVLYSQILYIHPYPPKSGQCN